MATLLRLNLPLFERLGINDKVERITTRKYGAEFVSLWHGKSVTFDFAVAWDKSLPNAYQIFRSEFDHILSKNAIDTGASFIKGCRVRTVESEPTTSSAAAKYVAALIFALFACGCASSLIDVDAQIVPIGPPVRFLLTFDDGPSIWQPYNPTSAILDQLVANPVQPQIKALFFVQTRARNGGGSEAGRTILRRIHAEGHALGLHSGSPRGHVSHRWLAPAELERSLADGTADIQSIAGAAPALVRPPFWSYDAATLAVYRRVGLHMLLTDISARDGKIYGWNISLRRRSHLRNALAEVRENIIANKLPVVDGVIPVVVTFHDTNTFTARHMSEYLAIVTEESARVGLMVAERPFYGSAAEIEKAALARSADAPACVAR